MHKIQPYLLQSNILKRPQLKEINTKWLQLSQQKFRLVTKEYHMVTNITVHHKIIICALYSTNREISAVTGFKCSMSKPSFEGQCLQGGGTPGQPGPALYCCNKKINSYSLMVVEMKIPEDQ